MNHIKRDITGAVDHALGQMPVVVITGIRQSGKSTLVLEDGSFKEREYFTLDDFGVLRTMKENPDALLEGYKALTIDEARRVKTCSWQSRNALTGGELPEDSCRPVQPTVRCCVASLRALREGLSISTSRR